MKVCPQCQRRFPAARLTCAVDGTILEDEPEQDIAEEEPTLVDQVEEIGAAGKLSPLPIPARRKSDVYAGDEDEDEEGSDTAVVDLDVPTRRLEDGVLPADVPEAPVDPLPPIKDAKQIVEAAQKRLAEGRARLNLGEVDAESDTDVEKDTDVDPIPDEDVATDVFQPIRPISSPDLLAKEDEVEEEEEPPRRTKSLALAVTEMIETGKELQKEAKKEPPADEPDNQPSEESPLDKVPTLEEEEPKEPAEPAAPAPEGGSADPPLANIPTLEGPDPEQVSPGEKKMPTWPTLPRNPAAADAEPLPPAPGQPPPEVAHGETETSTSGGTERMADEGRIIVDSPLRESATEIVTPLPLIESTATEIALPLPPPEQPASNRAPRILAFVAIVGAALAIGVFIGRESSTPSASAPVPGDLGRPDIERVDARAAKPDTATDLAVTPDLAVTLDATKTADLALVKTPEVAVSKPRPRRPKRRVRGRRRPHRRPRRRTRPKVKPKPKKKIRDDTVDPFAG